MEHHFFSIFIKKLDFAFRQFVIWKNLQNERYNLIFKQNEYLWTTLMRSLLIGFSIELAKLTEKQNSRHEEVISIFYLLELEIEDHRETLEKIKKLRNKVLMHNDLKTLISLDVFMSELDLKYGDIENIFKKLIYILDQKKAVFHNATDCEKYFSDLETFCVDDLNKFMNSLSKVLIT